MSRRYRLPRFNDQMLSEIMFGIENQDVDYMLDIGTGNLYSSEMDGIEPSSEENLVELPPWTSSDGYQLMVSFTNTCQNPQLKQKLVDELNSKSKGVFRRFRDVLSENPEDLKQWYDFKDRRMKSYIKSWYRTRFAGKDDDSDELEDDDLSEGALLSDFEVVHLDKMDPYCVKLLEEYAGDDPFRKKILDCFEAKEAFEVVCDGKSCGALIYEKSGNFAYILYYYIEEQDREMGLFSLMFDLFNRDLERNGVEKVTMPFSSESVFLRQTLSEHEAEISDACESGIYSVGAWNSATESAEFAYVL
jgi:hypothetical protein